MLNNMFHSLITLTVISLSFSLANASENFRVPPEKKLEPATRYSGRTPIDLSNGLGFNNGTYGKQNANYEKWAAAPTVAPQVSELSYPYSERLDFITGCEENARFFENAIFNWRQAPSANTKPEVKEYRDRSVTTMQPLLDRLMDALRTAKKAGKNDWEKAQSDTRHALAEIRATYTSFHKNVK